MAFYNLGLRSWLRRALGEPAKPPPTVHIVRIDAAAPSGAHDFIVQQLSTYQAEKRRGLIQS